MKIILYEQKSRGLSRPDVLIAILLVFLLFAILFAMVLPVNEAARRRAARINCVENLRQMGMELRNWEDDNGSTNGNGNAYGRWMSLLETNAQTVGLNDGQIAWINAMGITNFVPSTKTLQCPADKETPTTTSAAGLKIRISYFLNLDANEGHPQEMLAGDDNFVIGKPGEPEPVEGFAGPVVKPGLLFLSSNTLVSWSRARHGGAGNISLADGSVAQVSSLALQNAAACSFPGTPYSTNRLAIP